MLRILLIFTLSVDCVYPQTSSNYTLEFVQTVWRHGDRAARGDLFPIFEANWTFGGGGFGELTPLGMSQMKNLGKLFRNLYVRDKAFLSAKYVAKEIYIQSTDMSRTIISALSLLYGIFPPGNWNIQVDYPDEVDWQQGFTFVPVHVDTSEICAEQQCGCSRFNEIRKQWPKIPEVQTETVKMIALNRKVAALFNITKDQDNFNIYSDAWKAQRMWFNDTLYKELPFYNESLYQGSQTTFKAFKQLVDGYFTSPAIVNGVDIAHEASVIQAGPLLNEIYQRARDKAECLRNSENCTSFLKPLKFFGYSSHDIVLFAILVPLGLQDHVHTLDGWPDTAGSLTLELYSNPSNEFFVKFLYRDNSLAEFSDVTENVAGCNGSKFCALENFGRTAEKIKPLPDYQTLCQTPLFGSSCSFNYLILLIIALCCTFQFQ